MKKKKNARKEELPTNKETTKQFKGRKAQMLVLSFVGFLVAIVLFMTLSMQTLEIPMKFDYVGQFAIEIMNTYQEGEKFLFFMDNTAKQSAMQSAYDLAKTGGIDGGCGTHGIFKMWNSDEKSCFPTEENIESSFEKIFNKRFSDAIKKYPVFEAKINDLDVILYPKDDYAELVGVSEERIEMPLLERFAPKNSPKSGSAILGGGQCTYCGVNKEIFDLEGDELCVTAPCPHNMKIREVEHFYQCEQNQQCSSGNVGMCTMNGIDADYMCNVACLFKSFQQAYNYYGFYFNELEQAHPPINMNSLITQLFSSAERADSGIQRTGSDQASYDDLVEYVNNGGLAIIKLKGKNLRGGTCRYDVETSGYARGDCISYEHFVLVVGANEDYVVLVDPGTRYGKNLVLTSDFVKLAWERAPPSVNGLKTYHISCETC